MSTTAIAPNFAALVREFFCQRLITQQNASARTVASYNDIWGHPLSSLGHSAGP